MLRNLLNKPFKTSTDKQPADQSPDAIVDRSKLTGNDFEFLITPGDIEVKEEDFDRIMTPGSLPWTKTVRDGWPYFQVDNDEFSYSWEEPGIQMTFNKEISYSRAKRIADEVVTNLSEYTGQDIELIFIPGNKIISF